MTRSYQVLPPTAPVPAPDDYLEALVRTGAERMLQSAVEREVEDFLGWAHHERSMVYRGHRNDHHRARQIGVGMGAVEVRVPRVSDVPKEISEDGYSSDIVHRYERRSQTQARLLSRLYPEGLATGDFEPTFRALVGDTAALSPQSILRLKEEWKQEYENWRRRRLKKRYLYLFVDGFYVKAGADPGCAQIFEVQLSRCFASALVEEAVRRVRTPCQHISSTNSKAAWASSRRLE